MGMAKVPEGLLKLPFDDFSLSFRLRRLRHLPQLLLSMSSGLDLIVQAGHDM